MKKTILIIIALILCIFPVYAQIGNFAGSTVISINLANYEPDPAIAGNIVEARLGIENLGGTGVSNLMIEIMPEYPFELVSGESPIQTIGILQGYKADSTENIKIIKYRMKVDKDAPAGKYELKIKYYEKGSSASIQKSVFIDVKGKQSAEVIHIDKTTLLPGKQSSLKFTINNVGNAPLKDLIFNWENTNNIILPVGSDNTKYLKYIDIGQSSDVEYLVIADSNAQPGLYKLNLYLTYEDPISKTERKISTIAGVYVGGGTDFDIAFSESGSGDTSFSVANIGSNPAYSVSVIIPEQKNWRVSGSNSVIIGNLNKGDYTVASFKLQKRMNGSSEAIIMQISYTDTMGERKTVEKEVKVSIESQSEKTTIQGQRNAVQLGSFGYEWYLIAIIILVVGFAFYKKYKYYKLLNPNFKLKDLIKKK